MRRAAQAFARLLFCVCSARHGLAAPGPERSSLESSSYAIDIFEGPVLASNRTIGLGGAFGPLAQGASGLALNPASATVRPLWSHKRIDYDVTAGVIFPSALKSTDFDNNGSVGFAQENFVFVTVGGLVQFDGLGIGLSLDPHTYTIPGQQTAEGRTLEVSLLRGKLGIAWGTADGQWSVGLGARLAAMSLGVAGQDNATPLFSTSGLGVEVGALWAPLRLPLRASAVVRSQVVTQVDQDNTTAQPDAFGNYLIDGLFLPTRVIQPWEVEVGFAWQFGSAPLNLPFDPIEDEVGRRQLEVFEERRKRNFNEETASDQERNQERLIREDENLRIQTMRRQVSRERREHWKALPRKKLLLLSSLLLTGPVKGAVGLESFFLQQVERSGERLVITPRVGLESEPIAHWLQVRVGSYLEPSRFRAGSARLHGTGGFDLKALPFSAFGLLPEDTWWYLGGVVDVAERYLSFGLTTGIWH